MATLDLPGWPADADLSNRLGLGPGDDVERVHAANAAARAGAIRLGGIDPGEGPTDFELFEAVLLLGEWWYQNRNRPEGLDSLNPYANPYYRKIAANIFQAIPGRFPVA
jgi:hypothetical protein